MKLSRVLLFMFAFTALCSAHVSGQCGVATINNSGVTPPATCKFWSAPTVYSATANITLTTTTGCSAPGNSPLALQGACLSAINCVPTITTQEVSYSSAGTATGTVIYSNETILPYYPYSCWWGTSVTWNATCDIPCCVSSNDLQKTPDAIRKENTVNAIAGRKIAHG
jgi:hypothetical protein